MKISLAVFGAVWPILFNTMHAIGDIDPVQINTAKAFNLNRRQMLTPVKLPSITPFVLTGVRISASIALILIVSTEILAGGGTDSDELWERGGLGTFIATVGGGGARMDLAIAGTFVAGPHRRRDQPDLRGDPAPLGQLVGRRPRPMTHDYRDQAGEQAQAGRRDRRQVGGVRLLPRGCGSSRPGWPHNPYFPPPSTIGRTMVDLWLSGPPSQLFLTEAVATDIVPSLLRLLGGWAAGRRHRRRARAGARPVGQGSTTTSPPR